MKKYTNIKPYLLLTISLILFGCVPNNTMQNPYHAKMKSIEPGFHVLGSYDNKYRLKYVGESNATIESAKEIWLERAKGMCKESNQSITTDSEKVTENIRKEYHGNPNDDASAAAVCSVVGAIGCIVVDFLTTDYVVERKVKYPEIEGTVDCNPA
jgi:hypothetical protein